MSSVIPKEITNQIPKVSPLVVVAICIVSAVALTAFTAWHEEEHASENEQYDRKKQTDSTTVYNNITDTVHQEPSPNDVATRKEEIESKKDEIFARWLAQ